MTTTSAPTPAAPAATRYVYAFGNGTADGDTTMKSLLGGKGADLCEMARIGLPVPPGFVISTDACRAWQQAAAAPAGGEHVLPEAIAREVHAALSELERQTGRAFGEVPADGNLPLLVSVRSGAPVSMPGMMETVLNLGLSSGTVEQVAAASGNERLVWDAWRRFLQMYGAVVLDVDEHAFDVVLTRARERDGVADDSQLDAAALRAVAEEFGAVIDASCGPDALPADPREQLERAIAAVFASWNGHPARVYRAHHGIADDLGTAVNVQAMVYGNAGERSASGVLFTRDPATGARVPFGEYLRNAQGEDVVSGMRTPQPVAAATALPGQVPLEQVLPHSFARLVEVIDLVEQHYRDAQDMEFCIEEGELWMLQTRTAKRTAAAAVRIAVDMVGEGLIDRATAIGRVDATRLGELLLPRFERGASHVAIGHGLAASPGAATGVVAIDAADAVERAAAGEQVILVRGETAAADIAGMVAAAGVLTSRGGATSHAAVVARGMGRPCITACDALDIDEQAGTITLGTTTIRVGEAISIDGTSGDVLLGTVPTRPGSVDGSLEQLLAWADELAQVEVRANADDADAARRARELGARGIGLCRTEHMFFAADRLPLLVRTILAEGEAMQRDLLEQLSGPIEGEFEQMFTAMDGLPVTIRLIDPPLHEFLPSTEHDAEQVAASAGIPASEIRAAAARMAEANPMLGLRGVRVAIHAPVIYEMQVRWIVRAVRRARAAGIDARPAIMVPLVMAARELAVVRERLEAVLVDELDGDELHLEIGTMLEVPAACLNAGDIAAHADFCSFGTNDLTQMTLGLSRDDAERFLPDYVAQGIMAADPFVTIEPTAVAPLMASAVAAVRAARPGLELGACGEQAGDPASLRTMVRVGLDYVSCSPLRVPAARLAAAQAVT